MNRPNRKALLERATQEQRARQEAGSVILFFHEVQTKPRPWRRLQEQHYMRAYHDARYELRSTATATFLAIIQQSSSGPVEFLYNWKDISKLSVFPLIEVKKEESE